jgi:hypothetical protein
MMDIICNSTVQLASAIHAKNLSSEEVVNAY